MIETYQIEKVGNKKIGKTSSTKPSKRIFIVYQPKEFRSNRYKQKYKVYFLSRHDYIVII